MTTGDANQLSMGARMRQEADVVAHFRIIRSAEEKTQAKAWDDAAALWAQAVAMNPTQGLRSLRDDRRFQDLVGLADATLLSREAGWGHDLAFLAQEIKRIRYDPFQHIAEDAFDQVVQNLEDAIPTLTDDRVIVGLMRLVRALGDGHSTLALWELGERLPDAHTEVDDSRDHRHRCIGTPGHLVASYLGGDE